jgi:hypothetical protein
MAAIAAAAWRIAGGAFRPFRPMLSRRLLTALAASLFAIAPVIAQDPEEAPSLSVNPHVLTQGSVATISYSNKNLANQTVLIRIDDGMRKNTQTATVEIVLDEEGKGTGTWSVPNWVGAKFNAPDVTEVFCPVVRG